MIGDSLRRFRDKLGYSQGGLAESIGMKQTTWSGWENNPPDALEWLVALSEKYGVSVDYILGITDNPSRTSDSGGLTVDGQKLITTLSTMTDFQQESMRRIAEILDEVEQRARLAAIRDLALNSMKYIEELKGETAAEEFYQSVDLFRRTGDSSALAGWFSTYFGNDITSDDNE